VRFGDSVEERKRGESARMLIDGGLARAADINEKERVKSVVLSRDVHYIFLTSRLY